MANNPDTKLQANFKMANGDLINVYAVDQADFEAQPTCKHGYRELKSGTSKAGKAYKCWSCPSKDRKDQCDPIWVN